MLELDSLAPHRRHRDPPSPHGINYRRSPAAGGNDHPRILCHA